MAICGFLLISITALVFRAPPRPPVDLNGSAPTARHGHDTQPKPHSAHWHGTGKHWPVWQAKRGPDLRPLRVFVCVWALAASKALPVNAGPGVQQWRCRGKRLFPCRVMARCTCRSPSAVQAVMNVTTNIIYGAIHYWYWRDCILILSFAVKINTLHAGYKSVFAFNCKSE